MKTIVLVLLCVQLYAQVPVPAPTGIPRGSKPEYRDITAEVGRMHAGNPPKNHIVPIPAGTKKIRLSIMSAPLGRGVGYLALVAPDGREHIEFEWDSKDSFPAFSLGSWETVPVPRDCKEIVVKVPSKLQPEIGTYKMMIKYVRGKAGMLVFKVEVSE